MSVLSNLFKAIFQKKNLNDVSENSNSNSSPTPDGMMNDRAVSAEDARLIANTILEHLDYAHLERRRNSGYLARQEMQKIIEKIQHNPNRLEQYGYKVYSQNDEDGILEEIFKRIGVSQGVFCEIGVEDGLECNTLYLIHKGWKGAWFDGDLSKKPLIESKFKSLLSRKRLVLNIDFITQENINQALNRALAPLGINASDLDFLSIDIDGMDIYLLEALECSPKIICIEYNAKFPPPMKKAPVLKKNRMWEGTDYMGSSLSALNDVARTKGYSLVATNITGLNAFFVRNDLLKNLFDRDLTPEHLYNPPRYYLTTDHFAEGVGHKADFGAYTDLE